ncbi:MAG: carbon storage regulator [Planctomycetaceae bacterium]|jgi:carbon storage regulator
MLVLSRRLNEEIVIGGEIRVRIVHVGEGKVRVGIEAPATVGIRRGELADRSLEPVPTVCVANPVPAATVVEDSPSLQPVGPTSGRFVLPLLDLDRLPLLRRPR